MYNIVYFIGAGLTKSLEMSGWPVPTMWDFTSTMADYLYDDVVLNTMANLEDARIYEYPSEAAARLASTVVGRSANPSPENRAKFGQALKDRRRESIENLLERSLDPSGNMSAESAHQIFKYGINRLFCLVGWNINWEPLNRFLQRQMHPARTRHTFVSFNYDLILDAALQRACAAWTPAIGYGFPIPFFVADDFPQEEKAAGTSDWVQAAPFPKIETTSPATLLKPHGSLNWLVPYRIPYEMPPQGAVFEDKAPFIPLDRSGAIRYWCSTRDTQEIRRPDELPDTVGTCILPPSSAKRSDLSFMKASREAESDALVSADEVVVAGWSVPETDVDQAQLIEGAVRRRIRPLQGLTVVNRGAKADYFERLAHLFQVNPRAVRRCNSGFAEFASREVVEA